MRNGLVAAVVMVCTAGCLPEFVADAVDADAGADAGTAVRFHPIGYAAPAEHGTAMKMQKLPCRGCHGEDLTGGTGPGCDGCHTPAEPRAWRAQCTFCHGGGTDQTGAPPRHLDGTSDPASAKFPPHAAHVTSTLTKALDCTQCHVKATDALSPDHVFDSTPGVAETDFGGGLSAQASWDGKGNCANVYCHGSGRADDGVVSMSAGKRDCASCHPAQSSGATAWDKMSGLHARHLGVTGVGCADCHSATTADGASIADPARHVNGQRDVSISAAGFAFESTRQTCTGTCHGYTHTGSLWLLTGARFHPAGYAAAQTHGGEMEVQRLDCRGCHGATLAGGTGPSCDNCHKPAWRTNCTYCHGGGVNQTGAPPRDLAAAMSTVSQSFRAHTVHVTQRIAAAADCTTCHRKPTDVLSAGHAFDATAGAAEVTMAGGLSPTGTYDGNGGCANMYCHGNGRANGAFRDGSASPGCVGCHAGMSSGQTGWATMSGDHRRHLQLSGVTCGDCHRTVTTNGTTVVAPLLHVDGKRQVAFSAAGFTWDPVTRRCTGTCHGDNHNETW